MGILRKLGLRDRKPRDAVRSPLGGVECVSPSQITGWVYHPQVPLVEVRLLVGPHLIAQARLDGNRPDVTRHLGVDGSFGFHLSIPDQPLPLPTSANPRVVALNADGAIRFELFCIDRRQLDLTLLLKAALQTELRGLHGHFDGLTPDGMGLHGWCVRNSSNAPACVWLQSEGMEPVKLVCDALRPGMNSHGLPDSCGFLVALPDSPTLSGRSIWISYDKNGQLPLSSGCPSPLCLPDLSPSDLHEKAGYIQLDCKGDATVVLSSQSADFQDHWNRLEQFRMLLDRIEIGMQQARQADHNAAQLPPSKRRSARFRLWR